MLDDLALVWVERADSIKLIPIAGDGDVRRHLVFLEQVVALLKIFPELFPLGSSGLFHSLIGHAEGKKMDAEEVLPVLMGGAGEGVDFLDLRVRHGKTSDGEMAAMYHDGSARPVVLLIVCVGVPDVER